MLAIDDAQMPGLADLGPERLRVITGADEVELLRLRYRPGKRAILHVATLSGGFRTEGTLWFFGGGKALRIARRNRTAARFDPASGALYEAFPQDHRMPQIRNFLKLAAEILPRMTGSEADGAPFLLRYRPGLSCTFRCALKGQAPAYVKLVGDDDPVRLRDANRVMRDVLASSDLSLAPVLGIDQDHGAIAYASASGRPLDTALAEAGTVGPLEQALAGLGRLWSARIAPSRRMGPDILLARARESLDFVTLAVPSCRAEISAIVERLEATVPDGPLCPVHGDMKLEHVFLDRGRTTLIDTETLSLGLADYDRAQLYGRLWQAEADGHLPKALVSAAAALVRAGAGPGFDWCLGVVAARLAKYHAQRPGPGTADCIRGILGRLR